MSKEQKVSNLSLVCRRIVKSESDKGVKWKVNFADNLGNALSMSFDTEEQTYGYGIGTVIIVKVTNPQSTL
jgi:hypothetical protein